jgi:hypothetical protein
MKIKIYALKILIDYIAIPNAFVFDFSGKLSDIMLNIRYNQGLCNYVLIKEYA